jgi:hypothetical protein
MLATAAGAHTSLTTSKRMVNTAMKWAVVVKNLVGSVICEQEMELA